jgi:alpha-ribazole phosphatase
MTGRLLLIRHGAPLGHDGRCIGHFDTELDPDAVALLERLAASTNRRPRLIVASDLRRCARSARVLGRQWRCEVRFDSGLRELSFGDWEGRAWDDIAAADRAALDAWGADWLHVAPPRGESGSALAVRAGIALDGIVPLVAASGADVAVVSHAGWIRVAAALLLNEGLHAAFDRSIDYGRASILRFDEGTATVDAWNVDTLAVSRDGVPRREQPTTPL